jgi:hypothetical protein
MVVDSVLGAADLSIFNEEFKGELRKEMLPLFTRQENLAKENKEASE